ncbi:MAG: hypothetical protein CL678_15730 [Bdellovibrionaceae bacterium]|nr:hypothetical protein [Pseudobdellovibrionaceae bacterium]|tara:strand:+ start:178 stop:1026 length:849 start_codon:yes stop_codon:yes gene_type:complete
MANNYARLYAAAVALSVALSVMMWNVPAIKLKDSHSCKSVSAYTAFIDDKVASYSIAPTCDAVFGNAGTTPAAATTTPGTTAPGTTAPGTTATTDAGSGSESASGSDDELESNGAATTTPGTTAPETTAPGTVSSYVYGATFIDGTGNTCANPGLNATSSGVVKKLRKRCERNREFKWAVIGMMLFLVALYGAARKSEDMVHVWTFLMTLVSVITAVLVLIVAINVFYQKDHTVETNTVHPGFVILVVVDAVCLIFVAVYSAMLSTKKLDSQEYLALMTNFL